MIMGELRVDTKRFMPCYVYKVVDCRFRIRAYCKYFAAAGLLQPTLRLLLGRF